MTFRFSGTLLRFVDYHKEIALDAPDLKAALVTLCERHPGLRIVLYDAGGRVRATHRLFLNGEQLAGRQDCPELRADDTVEILTAIAGG